MAGMQVSCCPLGDFERIDDSGGYIWVWIKDALGVGIPGIPWTDYWLDACDPTADHALCLCPNPVVADSLTNASGRTTISGRLAIGGCILTGGIYIVVQGRTLEALPECLDYICLDLILKSPDRNHDCTVGVSDLVFLGDSYNKQEGVHPEYDKCCDWNHDGIVNISDFAFFGEHYTHTCF
jgi:hypothetical protein